MAKRKRNEDKFLRNSLLGFGGVLVLLIVGVVLANLYGPADDYSDFDHINNYAFIGAQDEDFYGVYFYSESCGACQSIKADMMGFSDSNELDMKVYMLDAQTTQGDRSFISLGGEPMNSTPTLLLIQNGTLVDYYVGADTITAFIENVENGIYSFD